jgi:hypothetical protein
MSRYRRRNGVGRFPTLMPRGLKAASILARQVDHIVCEMKRDLAGGEIRDSCRYDMACFH